LPTWGEILKQVQESAEQNAGQPDFDGIRRGYLTALQGRTGRDTIIYYSDWLGGSGPGITLEDMQGIMEVVRGLRSRKLDLLLHSPGGSAEATASIVRYLRRQFDDVRVFVPLAAMSAATMWALSANRIVMGGHSQLGPIDPQLTTPQGSIPARAVIDQFARAKRECAENPALLGAWLPILQQYGPALIEQCESAERLGRDLVREWLREFMLAGQPNAGRKAALIARYFGAYRTHRSHSLGINRDLAREKGVVVDNLEADQDLQDAVLSVHHATLHTFAGRAVKIVENHLGRAWVQSAQVVQIGPIPTGAPGGIPSGLIPAGLIPMLQPQPPGQPGDAPPETAVG
jgi:hypothetical protein